MKFKQTLLAFALSVVVLTSCDYRTEDPGPKQEDEKKFTVVDFDRLEISDAFQITVEQGDYFEVIANGDRRNIDDIEVEKEGSTLVIRYDDNRNRKHDTDITIIMPEILSATFSGATDSRISGFNELDQFDLYLSGGSVCQLNIEASTVEASLSGASHLSLRGEAQTLDADLSGASLLQAFSFPVVNADIRVSGASDGRVTVTDRLDVIASGASTLIYRGSPVITSDVSGASSVRQD
jgi:hypothetical protein